MPKRNVVLLVATCLVSLVAPGRAGAKRPRPSLRRGDGGDRARLYRGRSTASGCLQRRSRPPSAGSTSIRPTCGMRDRDELESALDQEFGGVGLELAPRPGRRAAGRGLAGDRLAGLAGGHRRGRPDHRRRWPATRPASPCETPSNGCGARSGEPVTCHDPRRAAAAGHARSRGGAGSRGRAREVTLMRRGGRGGERAGRPPSARRLLGLDARG